jgi:paired small multidrug resistance pump
VAWIALVVAGSLEILGVTMINQYNKDRKWQTFILIFVGFGLSFLFLSFAMRSLPMGTAYAIWTGIGAAGGSVIGMLLYGESKDWKRITFIGMVLSAAIGLKLLS